MNKKELIRTISQELDPHMSQEKIALILDKVVEITKRTLATGEPVKWSGFGSFVLKNNDSRDLERNNMLYRYPVHRKRLVVTKDVPAYTIGGGMPAREIRKRFDADTIDRLLQLRWWDWPIEKIRENIPHITNGDPDACCSSDIRRYL